MIIEKTIDKMIDLLDDMKEPIPQVSNVVIGLGYTGVEIKFNNNSSQLGVVYTLTDLFKDKSCTKIDFAGNLTKMTVQELLLWGKNSLNLEKIIGVATLNALSQYYIINNSEYVFLNKDLFEYLDITKSTKVSFIGLIKPMIRQFSETTQNITIIEKNLEFLEFFKNFKLKRDIADLTQEDLETDILICTGTSLINNTLEKILETYGDNAKFKCLIGPTASMIPDILFNYGVDLVGGMKFKNTASVLKILQEAGGTRFFKKFADKYNILSRVENN